MASSIDYIRSIDTALSSLKVYCTEIGVVITREEDINNGRGVKLHGIIENQSVAIVLYYNRPKGTSSKIVFEKIPEDKKALIIKNLSLKKSPARKTIPIHASIKVADQDTRILISDSLIAGFPNIMQCKKQEHMDYHVKIISEGNELTVTQFSSGALLLQGGYSDLVDRVVGIVDKIKPLSPEERALLYLPEETQEILKNKMVANEQLFDNVLSTAETITEDYVAFLFENDRKTFNTGDILTEILESHPKNLPEYNFLVAIFAKVFEGFVIKLMIEKNFITFEQYNCNPNKADIGNVLRKRKFEKYIKDEQRYGYIIEKLISVWEGSRCKEMHSDPAAELDIISVASLPDAKNKIGEIKSCMAEAFKILIRFGYTDETLPQKETKKDFPKIDLVDESLIKQKGYIGTDESGKGDYFGPLVIAGVFLDPANEKRLKDAGVRDSKRISDSRIHEFAKMIRSHIDKKYYSVVVINPEKYNELYAKIGNLNKLLAWGHARSIENILTVVDCDSAIADQFGDESYIEKALMEKGKGVKLLQMPKAEQHTAVAAASVLAREAFILHLTELSKKFHINLHKGASLEVENAARLFIEQYGMNQLEKCAKLHFKTTEKLRQKP